MVVFFQDSCPKSVTARSAEIEIWNTSRLSSVLLRVITRLIAPCPRAMMNDDDVSNGEWYVHRPSLEGLWVRLPAPDETSGDGVHLRERRTGIHCEVIEIIKVPKLKR